MEFIKRIFAIIFVLIVYAIYRKLQEISTPPPLPSISLDLWWGDGEKPSDWNGYLKNTSHITTNRLIYPDKKIQELSKRLNETLRLAEPLEGVSFEYGFNAHQLKNIVKYWRDDYLPRWRGREVFLWQFNHLTTDIQGLRMHFLHMKTYEENKVNRTNYPILLLHGFPGSVREFYSLIRKLHIPEEKFDSEYIFDVIAPSLPGFAWSQGTSKTGFGPAQAAVMIRNLMIKLGYTKFFIHGGDAGGIIGSHIATLFPDNVIGFHSNFCVNFAPKSIVKGLIANFLPTLFAPWNYASMFTPLSEKISFALEETGYFHLQATKPDTIGAVLSDNPIGLAAYILEKFSSLTNPKYIQIPNGGLTEHFELDALIDNVMIYYLTNSILTSQRIFAEHYNNDQMDLHKIPTKVPTGCARFRNDLKLFQQFDFQLRDKYPNLIHSKYHDRGGHFIAFELPDLLYADIIEFVKKTENFLKM